MYEGGMATVYLADDLKHERKVALKVLKPELAAVVGAERFLAEAVAYRLRRTQISVLNKVDLLGEGEVDRILEWVDDPEKLLDDLVIETKGVERERNQNLYIALRDFLCYLDLIPVSAKTMEGLERVYALVQQIVMSGEEVGE